MQIGTQLSFSFPQEMLGCSSRKEWEKGDRQEFLLHQSLKSLTFKHVQVCESCSSLALGNTCQLCQIETLFWQLGDCMSQILEPEY